MSQPGPPQVPRRPKVSSGEAGLPPTIPERPKDSGQKKTTVSSMAIPARPAPRHANSAAPGPVFKPSQSQDDDSGSSSFSSSPESQRAARRLSSVQASAINSSPGSTHAKTLIDHSSLAHAHWLLESMHSGGRHRSRSPAYRGHGRSGSGSGMARPSHEPHEFQRDTTTPTLYDDAHLDADGVRHFHAHHAQPAASDHETRRSSSIPPEVRVPLDKRTGTVPLVPAEQLDKTQAFDRDQFRNSASSPLPRNATPADIEHPLEADEEDDEQGRAPPAWMEGSAREIIDGIAKGKLPGNASSVPFSHLNSPTAYRPASTGGIVSGPTGLLTGDRDPVPHYIHRIEGDAELTPRGAVITKDGEGTAGLPFDDATQYPAKTVEKAQLMRFNTPNTDNAMRAANTRASADQRRISDSEGTPEEGLQADLPGRRVSPPHRPSISEALDSPDPDPSSRSTSNTMRSRPVPQRPAVKQAEPSLDPVFVPEDDDTVRENAENKTTESRSDKESAEKEHDIIQGLANQGDEEGQAGIPFDTDPNPSRTITRANLIPELGHEAHQDERTPPAADTAPATRTKPAESPVEQRESKENSRQEYTQTTPAGNTLANPPPPGESKPPTDEQVPEALARAGDREKPQPGVAQTVNQEKSEYQPEIPARPTSGKPGPRSFGSSSNKFSSARASFAKQLESQFRNGPPVAPQPKPKPLQAQNAQATSASNESQSGLGDVRRGRARGPQRKTATAGKPSDSKGFSMLDPCQYFCIDAEGQVNAGTPSSKTNSQTRPTMIAELDAGESKEQLPSSDLATKSNSVNAKTSEQSPNPGSGKNQSSSSGDPGSDSASQEQPTMIAEPDAGDTKERVPASETAENTKPPNPETGYELSNSVTDSGPHSEPDSANQGQPTLVAEPDAADTKEKLPSQGVSESSTKDGVHESHIQRGPERMDPHEAAGEQYSA